MKNPLTPAGIEPATFRFVAQHINHCATAVSVLDGNIYIYIYLLLYNRMDLIKKKKICYRLLNLYNL